MVGAVIVHKGQIIGEGYHRFYGGAHAEVNAIQAVRDETLLRDSTLYVNLEPCAHMGKTPPCTELILQKQIPRVVVGCLDPNPQVAGSGIKQLRDASVEVVTDVMKKEAMALNRVFITAHTKQRPYIILKWAQSRDGYIDRIRFKDSKIQKFNVGASCSRPLISKFYPPSEGEGGGSMFKVQGSEQDPLTDMIEKPVKFSTSVTRRYVHKLRSEVSAIMVGTNTELLDRPSLNVRHWVGNSPERIFPNRKLKNLLHGLYKRKLYSLLVEGGACLHTSFLEEGLWDELQIETAPIELHEGVKAPVIQLNEIAKLQKIIHFSSQNFSGKDESMICVYICKNL